jgi:hypothetical protein
MKKIREFLRSIFNPYKIETMATKYVAKKNDDGTIDLYQVVDSTAVDFSIVQTLVLFSTSVDKQILESRVSDSQSYLDDQNAQLAAVNALPAVTDQAAAEQTTTEQTTTETAQ